MKVLKFIGIGFALLLVVGGIGSAVSPSHKNHVFVTKHVTTTSATPDDSGTTDPPKPEMTSGQKNALESAQEYVDMSGFSKKGLIEQLSSSAGEGYDRADARFAANHVDVDWNAEAVQSAQDYLDMEAMSKSALIDQLHSSAGESFTLSQAEYGANKAY